MKIVGKKKDLIAEVGRTENSPVPQGVSNLSNPRDQQDHRRQKIIATNQGIRIRI